MDLNGSTSLFSLRGQQLSDFDYHLIEEKGTDLISHKNGRQGVIGQKGGEIIRNLYKKVLRTSDSSFILTEFPQWQFISLSEGIIRTMYYDKIEIIEGGKYKVLANNKSGIIGSDGAILLPVAFDSIYVKDKYFYGQVSINNENRWQIHTTSGDLAINDSFQGLYPIREDLVPVKKNGLWGYINPSG